MAQVTQDEAQELAAKPGATVLGADVQVPELEYVAAVSSRRPRQVGKADVAGLALGHVELVAFIQVLEQLQRDLRGGGLDRILECGHVSPHLTVGAYGEPSDRGNVHQRRPADAAEGSCHPAVRRRVAAPTELAGYGDLREGAGFNLALFKGPPLGGRLQRPGKKLRIAPYDGLMTGGAADAIVVGAGVIGLTCCWQTGSDCALADLACDSTSDATDLALRPVWITSTLRFCGAPALPQTAGQHVPFGRP